MQIVKPLQSSLRKRVLGQGCFQFSQEVKAIRSQIVLSPALSAHKKQTNQKKKQKTKKKTPNFYSLCFLILLSLDQHCLCVQLEGFQFVFLSLQEEHRVILSVVQSINCIQILGTPWTAAHQASLSFTVSWSLLRFMSIESMMPSNHLIFYHPLLLPSVFPSIRVFFNELAFYTRWPKFWSFSFSPFNEYSGLISFRIDWFDLPAVHGTLMSLI